MMRELALFAGAGGGLLATHHLLGWQCVGYVEMAEYPCKVLEARIKDGLLSPAPIFHMHTGDFIRLGYPAKYRGVVDVITAGFPCQPFSNAGKQQAGDDERNGWPDTIRIIREVRPEWVFLENVTGLLAGSHGYFGTVLGELAQSGYDAVWRVLSAAEVGAPHKRDRVWIVAHANGKAWSGARPTGETIHESGEVERSGRRSGVSQSGEWWSTESGLDRVVNGMPYRVDRLKAIGNGQVPGVVAAVWRILTENFNGL